MCIRDRYGIIRQTLKIGNVASMINAMMKVVLAKMSVASVTNWMGLTQGSDEGMNLLQQIISTVLGWDTKDLKSRASKIEKSKDGPKKEQFSALKAYLSKSREEHESLRAESRQSCLIPRPKAMLTRENREGKQIHCPRHPLGRIDFHLPHLDSTRPSAGIPRHPPLHPRPRAAHPRALQIYP